VFYFSVLLELMFYFSKEDQLCRLCAGLAQFADFPYYLIVLKTATK